MEFDPTKIGEHFNDHEDRLLSLEQTNMPGKVDAPNTQGSTDFGFPLDPKLRRIIENVFVFPLPVSVQGTAAATAGNYTHFFTADRTYNVVSCNEIHSTLGTDGGAVTLQLEKLTGTTAPGSGTVLLLAGFNLKSTINTVQNGTVVSTGATNLQKGDRLALKLTGTPTSVASVVVTPYLQYV